MRRMLQNELAIVVVFSSVEVETGKKFRGLRGRTAMEGAVSPAQVDEIRRHLANASPRDVIDSFAYANAIGAAFKESVREIQTVIRREAKILGKNCN